MIRSIYLLLDMRTISKLNQADYLPKKSTFLFQEGAYTASLSSISLTTLTNACTCFN